MKAQTARPHPITLPILIPCEEGDQEQGEVLVPSPSAFAVGRRFPIPVSRRVQRFKDTDFPRAQNLMGNGEIKRLKALMLLQTAIATKQEEDIKSAREELCLALDSDFQQIERTQRSLPPSRRRQRVKSIYPKGSILDELCRLHCPDLANEIETLANTYMTEDPIRLFAMEMSRAMSEDRGHLLGATLNAYTGVQLVMWQTGPRLVPALYCQNAKSAAYATALFGRRWKVCPYSGCGKWFQPTRTDEDYCCRRHRDAHRVARWRKGRRATSNDTRTRIPVCLDDDV